MTAVARAVAEEASLAKGVYDEAPVRNVPVAADQQCISDAAAIDSTTAQVSDHSGQPNDFHEPAALRTSPPQPIFKAQPLSLARRERRVARYEQVLKLHLSGCSQCSIKRQLHMSLETVQRFLRAGVFPEMSKHRCHSALDPLTGVLRSMWNAGTHNARELFKRLRSERYYHGGYDMVRRHVEPWKDRTRPMLRPKPVHPRRRRTGKVHAPRIASCRLAWLLSREDDKPLVTKHPAPNWKHDSWSGSAPITSRSRVRPIWFARNPIMRERSLRVDGAGFAGGSGPGHPRLRRRVGA